MGLNHKTILMLPPSPMTFQLQIMFSTGELGIQNHLHSRWYSGSPATRIFKGYTINYNNINNTVYTDQTVVSSFNVHPPWRLHDSLIL